MFQQSLLVLPQPEAWQSWDRTYSVKSKEARWVCQVWPTLNWMVGYLGGSGTAKEREGTEEKRGGEKGPRKKERKKERGKRREMEREEGKGQDPDKQCNAPATKQRLAQEESKRNQPSLCLSPPDPGPLHQLDRCMGSNSPTPVRQPKAGPLLPGPDSPPLQPPFSLPSLSPPLQHQPANVRKRGKRNIPDAEGKLEDIFRKKVEINILLN